MHPQVTGFNTALSDYSASKSPRLIDGIILTKFDNVLTNIDKIRLVPPSEPPPSGIYTKMYSKKLRR